MDHTIAVTNPIICVKCGASTTMNESTYVDGYGQLCAVCDPVPAWLHDIEVPY